uniref:Uncharacterized protein n=1 Tax=Opuntia streptacantha TaxID=393608 RepID=A0A7C9D2F3_OPUST
MSSQQLQLPVASSSSSSTRPSIFSHGCRLHGGNSVLLSRNAIPNLSLNLPRHRRPPIPVVRVVGDEAETLIADGDGGNAATATAVDEQEPEPTPEDLEYISQIKRVLELLRKNRDMLFGEVKLTIMIEDPREVERRRLLGIDDSDAPTREDLVEALEEVNEGKIPRNRVALRMLAEEMMGWPNLEAEAPKTKPKGKSLYAKTTDIGIDPEVAAKRLNIDWDSAAEIEDAGSADEADVPAAVGK